MSSPNGGTHVELNPAQTVPLNNELGETTMDIQDEFWQDEAILIELLFDSNTSIRDIANRFEVSQAEVNKRIKRLGLDWVKNRTRKMSRGQAALTEMLKKMIPGAEVVNEYHIGDRLRLDVFCPKYKLALEFHGRQHFVFNNYFYKDLTEFEEAQQRDLDKVRRCKELGITLVVFRYNDSLTEDAVYDRILTHLRDCEEAPPQVATLKVRQPMQMKGNPIYEENKRRQREWAKEMRQKAKADRKVRDSLKGMYG